MADSDTRLGKEDPDDVEPIRVVRSSVPLDPYPRGTSQLSLLTPVDRFDRKSELSSLSGLDLDERDESVPLDNEVDVPVAVAKPPLHDPPSLSTEPTLRYSLTDLPERLRGRGHGGKVGPRARG